jgi:hypothetical protein
VPVPSSSLTQCPATKPGACLTRPSGRSPTGCSHASSRDPSSDSVSGSTESLSYGLRGWGTEPPQQPRPQSEEKVPWDSEGIDFWLVQPFLRTRCVLSRSREPRISNLSLTSCRAGEGKPQPPCCPPRLPLAICAGSTCCSRRSTKEEDAQPLVRLVARDDFCNRRNLVPWLGNGRSGRSSLTVQELTGPNWSTAYGCVHPRPCTDGQAGMGLFGRSGRAAHS